MGRTWADPVWRAEVLAWAESELAAHGRPVSGPWQEARVRAWSVAASVPTTRGLVWLKVNGPGTAFEPLLVRALAPLSPLVVAPLAVDETRALSLTPDAGRPLREHAARADERLWADLLRAYARLQRAAESQVDGLLALGVPDARPALLPGLLADLLVDDEVVGGMGPGQLERLRALVPAYGEWCGELATGGVAPTVQHDDLHDANVLIPEPESGVTGSSSEARLRVIDWGDTQVAHPFSTLLITVRVLADSWGLDPADPVFGRLRDAYLEPWTSEHDPAHLRRLAELAVAVGPVPRSLAWRRALVEAPPDALAEWGPAVPGWLEELGGPSPS